MTHAVCLLEANLFSDLFIFGLLECSTNMYLEKKDSLFDREPFRKPLEGVWPWIRHDSKPGHRWCQASWKSVVSFIVQFCKTGGDLSDEAFAL